MPLGAFRLNTLAAGGEAPLVVTGPFTSDANTSFLLHLDGTNGSTTITDSSSNNKTFTVLAGSLDTSVKKFGTASFKSDAVNGGSFTYTEMGFGTGDFTYEGWFYQTQRSNYGTTFGTYIGGYIDPSGYPGFYSGGFRTGSILMALNTWTHIAYVRKSSVITVYVNGASAGSWANSVNFGTATVGIGGNADKSYQYASGYFDEIRVSNIARYSAAFTVN